MRRERNEICRPRHQATTFFECANQTDQDANIRNFLAEPSNSHVNSAAEELGLETMGTVKDRIVRRPDNCVTNESFEKTESHAIRDNRDHRRRTSRRSGRTVLAKVGRTDSEERVIVRDPNKVVRPAAGSILCRSKRVIIINDESKSRHPGIVPLESRFGETAGSWRRRRAEESAEALGYEWLSAVARCRNCTVLSLSLFLRRAGRKKGASPKPQVVSAK